MRFNSGNQRSIATSSEQTHQQTGIRTASKVEFASLASPRKYPSHTSRHDHRLRKIQKNTNTVQAVYHLTLLKISHKRKELTRSPLLYLPDFR